MGKRGSAGEVSPAETKKQLLRMFKLMFEKFGVMPDVIRGQDLRFFLLMRMADDNAESPLSYPEDADFT